MKTKTEAEIVELLRTTVAAAPSLNKWARAQRAAGLRISPAYVSSILNGKMRPGVSILTALGYRRVMTYEEIPK